MTATSLPVDWLACIHPARLIAAMAPIDPGMENARAMLALPSLQQTIAAVLMAHFEVASPAAAQVQDPTDRTVAMLSPENWAALPRACGVAYWQPALAHEIRHAQRATLQARLGDGIFDRDAEPRAPVPTLSLPATVDLLDLAIERDGAACVAAWIANQSAACTAWLALKTSTAPAILTAGLTAQQQCFGPAIVRAEAARLLRNQEQHDA